LWRYIRIHYEIFSRSILWDLIWLQVTSTNTLVKSKSHQKNIGSVVCPLFPFRDCSEVRFCYYLENSCPSSFSDANICQLGCLRINLLYQINHIHNTRFKRFWLDMARSIGVGRTEG
jgi:hypothetical protein